MSEIELKNCHCGGKATFVHVKDFWDESYKKYGVRCLECGLETKWYDTKTQASKAWDKLREKV